MNRFELAITPGDPEGIGPEVTAKALLKLEKALRPVSVSIFGSKDAFKREKAFLRKTTASFIEPPARSSPGYQSGWAIQAATQFVMSGNPRRALVTGPISKERLTSAGFKYAGHTEFLADLTGANAVTMMLSNELFRVTLVTNHCPLKDVSARITRHSLERTLQHSLNHCRTDLGKKNPKIAVLSLNPHAGEGGLLGLEEKEIIIPTLKDFMAKNKGVQVNGPFPADSFFALEALRSSAKRHDIIIAQYHDQGLIPVKLSDFSCSMNMTLGLPIIRTSVDHGTAFDLAGKDRADPGSMIYAIEKALYFLKNRRRK